MILHLGIDKQPTAKEYVSGLSTKHNFLWSLVGVLTYSGCQFVLIIMLTRLGNTEMVGTFILAMAIAAPFQIIGAQLASIQSTDITYKFSFNNYLTLGLASGFLIILGAPTIGKLIGYNTEIMLIILGISIAKALENVSLIFLSAMQMNERMDLYSISLIIKGSMSLVVFSLLLYFSHTLLLPVLGLVAVNIIILLSYDLPIGYKVSRKVRVDCENPVTLRDMIGLSRQTAPLSLTALLSSLNQAIPRFFLERSWGLKILGYFGPIAYVMTFGDLMAAALGRTMAPRLARYWFLDRQAFQPAVNKLLVLTGVFGLISILLAFAIGGQALTLLFGSAYAPYNSVLIWLTVAMACSVTSHFFSYLLLAMRLLNIQAVLILITFIITVSFCFILTPSFGLWGTAWAICIGQFIRLIGSYLIYFRAVARTSS